MLIISCLYERYSHLVFGVCLKYLKQKADSEDTTLQIFSVLPEKILKHEITFFKSWLYQVTKNECLLHLRGNKSKNLISNSEIINNVEDEFIALVNESRFDLLEHALHQLKAEQRKCIELFYYQQKSYLDISIELNTTVNAVKSAIQNGKRNLKIWIETNETK